MRKVLWCLAAAAATSFGAGCEDAEFQGAEAEVKRTDIKLDLPPVPDFDLPEANPDGTENVPLMRLQGRNMLDNEVELKGYVTWIYDCGEALRSKDPELSDKEVATIVDEQGSKCWLPHFYVGETPETPPEDSLWVVEVPRELKKWEKKGMTREELAELPPVPEVEVGDEVLVKGTWAQKSPKGFARTEGLLVYKELENLSRADEEEQ